MPTRFLSPQVYMETGSDVDDALRFINGNSVLVPRYAWNGLQKGRARELSHLREMRAIKLHSDCSGMDMENM